MTKPLDPRTQAAMDTPGGKLARQLYGLAAVRRELGKVANRTLPGHGFGALVSIRKRDQARVSDIAADLQIDLSVASRQVASLVSAGLVARQPDPADRRAHVLELTTDGVSALRESFLDLVELIDASLVDWTQEEVETLATSLERLVTSFTATATAAADQQTASATTNQEVPA